MADATDLDGPRYLKALSTLVHQCRQDMQMRWPSVNFDSNVWPTHSIYGTKMVDARFVALERSFRGRDKAYVLAARCLVARAALEGKKKTSRNDLSAWRLLSQLSEPLTDLRSHHLRGLEEGVVKNATPSSAQTALMRLLGLSRMLDELGRLGAVGFLAWSPNADSRLHLLRLATQQRQLVRARKSIEHLDRRIEGLSDATKAMLQCDQRLSAEDRSAIAFINIMMCAPSRINEPLCLGVADRYTLDDYTLRPDADDAGQLFQVHQLLLMKGSKGADWSGKPVLNFMLGLSEACWSILLELGKRSRRLLQHYEEFPDRLYLPIELEHLRGKAITSVSMWQITNLTAEEPDEHSVNINNSGIWSTYLRRHQGNKPAEILIDNPITHRSDGQRTSVAKVRAIPWEAGEAFLLQRVQERMATMRRVTPENWYRGKLSEMLVLVDAERSSFLPQAWNHKTLRSKLKTTPSAERDNLERSVFIKLGLKMVQDDALVDCYLEPHDTRRWLTTKALHSQKRISDVLINKWANRISTTQLSAYDLRTPEQQAEQSSVPLPKELESISRGLSALDGIEAQYGLLTHLVVAHGDELTVTSVDEVLRATENRPIARSSNQIVILYPNRFGVCLHQHHEAPCRAYGGCSEGCSEQLTIKGHLPTNEEWRKRDVLNGVAIVSQLEALVSARNRQIADDCAAFDAHLLHLVGGLDAKAMADSLIDRFHEIKEKIRDIHFRNELEAAFVSRGVVARLDDPAVPSGALIKYHNPARHASPGFERALEAHWGSRQEMELLDAAFHDKHPELAPGNLGLQDDREGLKRSDGIQEGVDGEGSE